VGRKKAQKAQKNTSGHEARFLRPLRRWIVEFFFTARISERRKAMETRPFF